MANSNLRFQQWIQDTCLRPYDQDWINYQHEIALRHTSLKKNKVDTIQGRLRFDGPNNYGDDLMDVKQVQNGKWVVVWPKDKAAPGATLQAQ